MFFQAGWFTTFFIIGNDTNISCSYHSREVMLPHRSISQIDINELKNMIETRHFPASNPSLCFHSNRIWSPFPKDSQFLWIFPLPLLGIYPFFHLSPCLGVGLTLSPAPLGHVSSDLASFMAKRSILSTYLWTKWKRWTSSLKMEKGINFSFENAKRISD